jgi:hypothetical protein
MHADAEKSGQCLLRRQRSLARKKAGSVKADGSLAVSIRSHSMHVDRRLNTYHHEGQRMPQELDIYKGSSGGEQDATKNEHIEKVRRTAPEGGFF